MVVDLRGCIFVHLDCAYDAFAKHIRQRFESLKDLIKHHKQVVLWARDQICVDQFGGFESLPA